MNVEMILTSLINAIIFVILEIYVGEKITKEKVNFKNIYNIIICILYTLFLASSVFISDKFLTTLSLCINLMIVYKKNIKYRLDKECIIGYNYVHNDIYF